MSIIQKIIKYARKPDVWLEWTGLFAGCFIMAIGFVVFINPYNLVPGGVYGASIVLHNVFPNIQVGTFGYMFDIPLLIISFLVLGSKLGARTVVAAMTTPAMMNIITLFAYPDKESLRSLDPQMLLGGTINLSNDLILAVVFGSLLIGLGVGMIVRCQATSGGTDIIGMIMQKYLHIPFSNAILVADGFVVFCGLVVIGLGIGANNTGASAIYLSLYSLLCIYISSRVIAFVISGSKDDKMMFVISDSDLVTLHEFILTELDRTATFIKAQGLYSHNDKEMLFLVVKQKEIMSVKKKIKEADPRAFVVVTDAYDILGEGWQQLPNKDDIQPQ